MSIRIKYLEKDNKDLELDLEDVDATLQINKNIINALIDSKDDPNMSFKQAITGFQQEIESMELRNKRILEEREMMKTELLLHDQMKSEILQKEKEVAQAFEMESNELREQLEKKEYTLQLLEQRLFDVELFLRKWGREEDHIREQLTALKINPDLRKNKITNTVEQNKDLKLKLKNLLDEVEELREYKAKSQQNVTESTKSGEGAFNYCDNSRTPPRNAPYEDKGLDLSAFVPQSVDQSVLGLEEMRSYKDAYPQDFNNKLEKNYEKLEDRIQILKRQVKELKKENSMLKDQKVNLDFINKRLQHAMSKKGVVQEAPRKAAASPFERAKTTNVSMENRHQTPEHLVSQLKKMKRSRKSDLLSQLTRAEKAMGGSDKKAKKNFADVSSILMGIGDEEDQMNIGDSSDDEDLENILEKDDDEDSFNEGMGPVEKMVVSENTGAPPTF